MTLRQSLRLVCENSLIVTERLMGRIATPVDHQWQPHLGFLHPFNRYQRLVSYLRQESHKTRTDARHRLQAQEKETMALRHQLQDLTALCYRLRATEQQLQNVESGEAYTRLQNRLDKALATCQRLAGRCERLTLRLEATRQTLLTGSRVSWTGLVMMQSTASNGNAAITAVATFKLERLRAGIADIG